MTKTQASAKKFRNAIEKEFNKTGRIESRVAVLDTTKDFDDIFNLCTMIINGETTNVIERKFGHLDTVVRDVFPLTIFDDRGYLVGGFNETRR